jgi:endonuclease III
MKFLNGFLLVFYLGREYLELLLKKTYRTFEHYDVLTPKKIVDAGRDELVRILDEGGYVRYDFSTADKLLGMCKTLLKSYGSITSLYEKAKDAEDLEQRLLEFKGIGSVTVNIFLRELRPF